MELSILVLLCIQKWCYERTADMEEVIGTTLSLQLREDAHSPTAYNFSIHTHSARIHGKARKSSRGSDRVLHGIRSAAVKTRTPEEHTATHPVYVNNNSSLPQSSPQSQCLSVTVKKQREQGSRLVLAPSEADTVHENPHHGQGESEQEKQVDHEEALEKAIDEAEAYDADADADEEEDTPFREQLEEVWFRLQELFEETLLFSLKYALLGLDYFNKGLAYLNDEQDSPGLNSLARFSA